MAVGDRRPFGWFDGVAVVKTSSSLLGSDLGQVDEPLPPISLRLLFPGDVNWSVRGVFRAVSNAECIVACAAASASSASSLEGHSNASSCARVEVSLMIVGVFKRSVVFASPRAEPFEAGVIGACALEMSFLGV